MKYLGNFVKISYILGLFISIIAIFLKIQHRYPVANTLLIIGLLCTLVFICSAIIEIHNSKKLEGLEKFMWTIGLITMSTLIGTIYVFSARKRIVID